MACGGRTGREKVRRADETLLLLTEESDESLWTNSHTTVQFGHQQLAVNVGRRHSSERLTRVSLPEPERNRRTQIRGSFRDERAARKTLFNCIFSTGQADGSRVRSHVYLVSEDDGKFILMRRLNRHRLQSQPIRVGQVFTQAEQKLLGFKRRIKSAAHQVRTLPGNDCVVSED